MNNTTDPDTDPGLEVIDQMMRRLGRDDRELFDVLLETYDAGYKQAVAAVNRILFPRRNEELSK